jgi:hypothetical protein
MPASPAEDAAIMPSMRGVGTSLDGPHLEEAVGLKDPR